jgi:hypothetical protein
MASLMARYPQEYDLNADICGVPVEVDGKKAIANSIWIHPSIHPPGPSMTEKRRWTMIEIDG